MTYVCRLEHEGEECGSTHDSDSGLSQHLFASKKDEAHEAIETRRETYQLIEKWESGAQGTEMLTPDGGGGADEGELPTCNSCDEELAPAEELRERGTFSCSSCGHRMRWTDDE